MRNIFTKISLLRSWIITFMLMLATICAAQTNGDKLFLEGQTLQKEKNIASQNQAIKKFKAAKVIYTTPEKKKMCDNQIAICNSNIASLRKKPDDRHKTGSLVSENKLSLSQNSISFDGDKNGATSIAVTAPNQEWHFRLSEGVEGEDNFVKANRSSDSKSIDIEVSPNPYTTERHQSVLVLYGNLTETLIVSQSGRDVNLSTNTNLIEFKLKGGSKTLELYTNSDSIVASNNGLTWYVESKPDWIETSVEVKKKKSTLEKGLSAIKGLVSGSSSAATETDVKMSSVKIVARPLPKNDPEYATGRRGEIIFASQDKKHMVTIIQQ